MEIVATILSWIGYLFAALGVFDCYIAFRFLRKGEGIVDQTAGFLSYWFVKWLCTTQTEAVAHCLPFVKQDLSEMLGFRKDDEEIT